MNTKIRNVKTYVECEDGQKFLNPMRPYKYLQENMSIEGENKDAIEYVYNTLARYSGENSPILAVAKVEEQVVGYILSLVLEEKILIDMLYVDPIFREKGIGSKLLKCILTCAKENKYNVVELITLKSYTNVVKLYEKFGFKEEDKYSELKNQNVESFFRYQLKIT